MVAAWGLAGDCMVQRTIEPPRPHIGMVRNNYGCNMPAFDMHSLKHLAFECECLWIAFEYAEN